MAFKPTYSQVKLSFKKTSFHFRRLSGWRWSKAFQAIPIEVAFLYVVDFLALPHHLFRWVGYMKTRGNQMMLLAIPWRYDSKLPTTISKRENENPRLFVAGCSVFDLKTLISEANSAIVTNKHPSQLANLRYTQQMPWRMSGVDPVSAGRLKRISKCFWGYFLFWFATPARFLITLEVFQSFVVKNSFSITLHRNPMCSHSETVKWQSLLTWVFKSVGLELSKSKMKTGPFALLLCVSIASSKKNFGWQFPKCHKPLLLLKIWALFILWFQKKTGFWHDHLPSGKLT